MDALISAFEVNNIYITEFLGSYKSYVYATIEDIPIASSTSNSMKVTTSSTSYTSIGFAITMFRYYICSVIVLTVTLVLQLGLGFGIILYFVTGTLSNSRHNVCNALLALVEKESICCSELLQSQVRMYAGLQSLDITPIGLLHQYGASVRLGG